VRRKKGKGGRGAAFFILLFSICSNLTIIYFYGLQDVLLYYGAREYGTGPEALGDKSPRNSFDPSAPDFLRERGSYQSPFARPG
jgi:hypothetical protein